MHTARLEIKSDHFIENEFSAESPLDLLRKAFEWACECIRDEGVKDRIVLYSGGKYNAYVIVAGHKRYLLEILNLQETIPILST